MVGGTVQPQRVSGPFSLINGNLQGKYAFWARLANFYAEDTCEFST